jgi:membrane associated rhomboid family serine protease
MRHFEKSDAFLNDPFAASRIVILYIIVLAIRFIALSFVQRLAAPLSYAYVTHITGMFTGVTAFIGYYVLFFKLSLWKQNRELNDEE